jgi:predicted O-methyltransferase YrrM
MNSILDEMLRTHLVQIEGEAEPRPLDGGMNRDKGALIVKAIEAVRPAKTLETGCAYGVSTLFALETLAKYSPKARHTIIDPAQGWAYGNGGLNNAKRAGYGSMVEMIEESSATALPRLMAEGRRVQFAIIDGWHTFDHALIDFFYINKMLDVGGIVLLDDTDWPGLRPLDAHIRSYPCYEAFDVVRYRPRTARGRLRAMIDPSRRRPTCVAYRKIAEDERSWDWYAPF